MTNIDELKDGFHRGAKLLTDSGEASSVEAAMRLLAGYRFTCIVGPEIARSPTLQAALLTAVNTGHRACLGGVSVVGVCPDTPLLLPLGGARKTLAEAIARWGGTVVQSSISEDQSLLIDSEEAIVYFGTDEDAPRNGNGLSVRVTFDGWCAAVAPLDSGFRLAERQEFPLSGVMAGALAVSEVFQHLRGNNVTAMRRKVGLSLWRPDAGADGDASWMKETGPEITHKHLPPAFWLLGLGHLGQAYLWGLMLLPYADRNAVHLVLQDFDRITPSGISTGLLTDAEAVGRMKTRRMAEVVEAHGFKSILVERPFDQRLRVGPDDPQILLCGVDNLRARRFLEEPGFAEVIEAGLGHSAEEYQAIRLHTFPARRTAEDVFRDTTGQGLSERLLDRPAYQSLRSSSGDECGVVQLANASVGVPFVGVTAGALAVAEAIRALLGEARFEVIDTNLGSPTLRSAVLRQTTSRCRLSSYTLSG